MMLTRWGYKALIIACFLALVLGHSAIAAAVVAHGSQLRDFHRLTFEWPRPTYLTADIDGQVLTIHFERKATPDMTRAIKSLRSVIQGYSFSTDQQTLTIKLKGNYRARSFVSGSVSGVDIIPSESQPAPAKVIAGTNAVKLERLNSEPVKQAATSTNTNLLNTSAEPLDSNLTALSPAAGGAEENPAAAPKASIKKVATENRVMNQTPITLREKMALRDKQRAQDTTTPVSPKVVAASPKVEATKVVPEQAPMEVAQSQEKADVPAKSVEVTPPTQEEPTVPVEETSAPKPIPVEVAAPTRKPAAPDPAQAALMSVGEEEDVPASEVAEDAAEDEPDTDEQEVVAAEPQLSQPVVIEGTEAENAQSELASNEEENSGDEEVQSEDSNTADVLPVRARLDGEELQIIFPWQKRTAAAAYVRNDIVWIVFDNVVTLDLRKANTLLRAGVTIKQIQTNEATILYIPISSGAGVDLKIIEGTFRWQAQISTGEQDYVEPTQVQLQTDPPLKPHVLLPLLDVAKVVRFKDPIVGDELDILPIFADGKGISPARSFPEFSLLDTIQGLVVLRKSNDTTVEIVRNGVRVSTHQGATISPDLPHPEEVQKEKFSQGDGVLLPFKDWKVKEGINYTDEIQLVKKQIARSLAGKDVDFFLKLAQLHLAYGEAVEALGYLQNIKRMDSEMYIKKRLSAMQGAANFLLHRYKDAARNFRVRELKDLEETKFWQVMLAELLGKPTRQFDYEANYEPFIQHYPPVLQQRIGIFAADRYIASKDYNAALKIFDQLNEHKLINEVADYINYLMGKIALETQSPNEGYRLWLEIINGPATEFVKVRAEFALVIETLKRGEITKEQAVEKLESIAMRWRGDNLELAVLSALSNIYEEEKNWPQAMRVWRSMNEAFPNTQQAVEVTRKLDEAFVSIFDRGQAGGLTDLEQMFLYTEHRDLLPEDDSGDRIVENLANLMVKLDMLDQAAEMLDSRMRFRFEHVDRSKVGAKLAEIYLLDQKPKKALEALQLSVFGVLPEQLLKKRTYLSAEALLQLSRFADLFLLLEGDKSAEADYYRLQAYWQAKDWRTLAENGESLLKNRSNPTAPLTDMERDTLVKLALAYVALGEHEQIAYLRDYFTPLMKGQPASEIFTYLTLPYLNLTPNNFEDVVKILDKTKTFLVTDYGTKPTPDPDVAPQTGG